MTPTQTELRSRLAIKDFAEQRKAIRELFTRTLNNRWKDRDHLVESVKLSQPCKWHPKTVRERQTFSVIRDNMTVCTMAVIIEFLEDDDTSRLIEACRAIEDPAEYATKNRYGKPSFAEHVNHKHYFNGLLEEKPMSMTAALNAYDALRINGYMDETTIWEDIAKATDQTTSDGVKSLVSIREEKDVPRTMSDIDVVAMSEEDQKTYQIIYASVSSYEDEPEVEEPKTEAIKYTLPKDTALVDLALKQSDLPPIADIIDQINTLTEEVAKAHAAPTMSITETSEPSAHDGTIPSGKLTTVNAADAFKLTRGRKQFGFKIPMWQWDSPHPHVPEIDENYVFRPFELLRVLYAIMTNQRCYLHGHTGSGKTTLVEQVAAHLNWPFMRVNFDSEITRMDLIGRDVLTNESGVTSSKFVDGILPQMMSGPYIGCLDEIDFVRPDIAYVLQRAAEGNGLMLTEDGGRMVKPHKLFRMFATGNTVGQGDEFGMYQGARPQSMAFLDRFTVWVKVDYLKPADRLKLIKSRLPKLAEDQANRLNNYVTEHLEAFTSSKVMQPISPRGFLSLGQAMCAYLSFIDDEKRAVEEAIATTILDRASTNDRAVLKAISQRVWG